MYNTSVVLPMANRQREDQVMVATFNDFVKKDVLYAWEIKTRLSVMIMCNVSIGALKDKDYLNFLYFNVHPFSISKKPHRAIVTNNPFDLVVFNDGYVGAGHLLARTIDDVLVGLAVVKKCQNKDLDLYYEAYSNPFDLGVYFDLPTNDLTEVLEMKDGPNVITTFYPRRVKHA